MRTIAKTARMDMNLRTVSPGPGRYNNGFKHLVRMSRVKNHTGTNFGKQVRDCYKDVVYQA